MTNKADESGETTFHGHKNQKNELKDAKKSAGWFDVGLSPCTTPFTSLAYVKLCYYKKNKRIRATLSFKWMAYGWIVMWKVSLTHVDRSCFLTVEICFFAPFFFVIMLFLSLVAEPGSVSSSDWFMCLVSTPHTSSTLITEDLSVNNPW